MAHHHHHREEEREERREEREERREERREEQYERRQEYGGGEGEGYGRRTETQYGVDGGYGRRTDEYEVQPDGYGRHTVTESEQRLEGIENARRQETSYQRTEYLGKAGAVLGAGFAMYERREEEKDPANARRHKIEEDVAEGLAVGGVGTAFYGHHKKEKDEEQLEELETGHKKHNWFG